MDVNLWPARNVAEYAYCPRLFYYMEVEGIHLKSEDTEQGQRIHKRVDSPSSNRRRKTADSSIVEEPISVRSLTLTSQSLRLTATLDLAEITQSVAVPIEYRKGRPRLIEHGESDCENYDEPQSTQRAEPWPTDRIQLGLQVILLEEAGYTVPRGILYYASVRRRIEVEVTEELRREALETLTAAQISATGSRPLPLVNDPKCPRCSLQPICLPDEIHAERGGSVSPPRKRWPPRDDGIQLVAQRQGTRIGIRGAALHVSESDGATSQEIPLASVESLSLLGAVQISTQSLQALSDRGIPVAFLSAAGRLITMLDPLDSVSAETRRNQVRVLDRTEACLSLSRQLILGKIRNQRTLLIRNGNHVAKSVLESLAAQASATEKAESIESLRGHEGLAAALYFENFAGMIKSEAALEFDQNGRQRRPPPGSHQQLSVTGVFDADT